MIRTVGKSLAIAATLIATGAGAVVVRAQYGLGDDPAFVPPSPAPAGAPVRSTTNVLSNPLPLVTSPKSTTATQAPQAYGAMRSSNVSGQQIRSAAAGLPMNTKVGPYGVGKRPLTSPTPSRVTQTGHLSTPGSVKTAGHFDETSDPGFMLPVPPPAADALANPPTTFLRPKTYPEIPAPSFPTERIRPPTIMGSHLGLQPGETATERSLRLMTAVGDLERQLDSLDQRNADLIQQVKTRDDQLLLAIREIRSARKEVSSARDELESLKQQVRALQEKVRDAERDNAAVLQTMAPLLQKLLEADSGTQPQE